MEIRETLTMSVYMHICPNIQIPKRAWVVYTLGGRDWVHYGVVQAVRSLRKLCQLAYCSRDVKESFKGGNFLQISCDSTHDKGPFFTVVIDDRVELWKVICFYLVFAVQIIYCFLLDWTFFYRVEKFCRGILFCKFCHLNVEVLLNVKMKN